MKKHWILIISLAMAAMGLSACSEAVLDAIGDMKEDFYELASDIGSGGGDGHQGGRAGVLTAGEWNDLDNWEFWGNLLNNKAFSGYEPYWKMYTDNRVAVKVTGADDEPAAGVKVELKRGGKTLWSTMTDNAGTAECWVGFFQRDSALAADSAAWKDFTVAIDGKDMEAGTVFSKRSYPVSINEYKIDSYVAPKKSADIAFIVDATGSMSDEIDFLKEDLMAILNAVKDSTDIALRTGTVFYRDEGDSYLTRFSQFTEDIAGTVGFISEQSANGGGDYEEAVHSALESSLQDLSWDETGRARIAFLVFDAPAHQNHKGVVESLHKSVENYARKGIKIIPVLASGGSKEAEFMGRLFAICTNGTYVFLTDDSGVGGDHIQASVGEYQVEKLGDLLVRLILANIR